MLTARLGLSKLLPVRAQRPSNVGNLKRGSCAPVAGPSRITTLYTSRMSSQVSNSHIYKTSYSSQRSNLALQTRNYSSYADITYRPENPLQAPYNEKITSLIGQEKYQEALSVFEEMTSNSISPNETTFTNLALAMAYMNPKSSSDYLVRIADQYESFTKPVVPVAAGKSILSRLAKKMKTTVEAPRASHMSTSAFRESERFMLEEEPEIRPSFLETQNAALGPIFKVWIEQKAPEVLIDFMLNHHVKPRYIDLVLALEQCVKYRKAQEGWKVYRKWRATCPGPLVFHLAVVLCAEQIQGSGMANPDLPEKEVLARMQLINEDMADANQLPTYQTQAFLLRHWGAVGRNKFAFKLFENMLADSYIADSMRMSDYNVVLNLYAASKQIEPAEKLFESLRTHPRLKMDVSIYTTMVKVYARSLDAAKAWALVGEMVRHGSDPALYTRARGTVRRHESDIWPTNITLSILLDMESRVNGPVSLIETFESIRNTYHLTPSLNNWGALLEQLASHEQYISMFDWFIAMMRTQSLRVTLRECCYLTLLDPTITAFTPEEKEAVTGIRWTNNADLPELTADERRKWIATVFRWKDLYIRNNALKPPPELDMIALHKIRSKLSNHPEPAHPSPSEIEIKASS